jgi:hypothetical protein
LLSPVDQEVHGHDDGEAVDDVADAAEEEVAPQQVQALVTRQLLEPGYGLVAHRASSLMGRLACSLVHSSPMVDDVPATSQGQRSRIRAVRNSP